MRFFNFHPVPRVHRILWNMGMSAAGAAELIRSARVERAQASIEVIRIAWHNRHSLKTPMPYTRHYR
jgi:hypothetical protein